MRNFILKKILFLEIIQARTSENKGILSLMNNSNLFIVRQ